MDDTQTTRPDGLYAEARHLERHPNTPALVLMPYLAGTTREWDEVLALLGPAVPTLALDLPGFGGSAHLPGYTVQAMADQVEAAIERAGLIRFVLVGHSMAGKVSAVLARRWAGDPRLAGLVLVAPSPPSPEPMGEEKRHMMLGLLSERHPTGDFNDEARARKYVTKNEERDLPKAVEERTVREVLRMNRTAWVAWLEHGSREDWSAFVGVLDLPALVVAGEKDASLGPKQQREVTLPHLKHARLESVAGCSHLIPMERPELLAGLLQDFLAGLPRVAAVPQVYREFIASDRVSVPTRAVLEARMAGPAASDVLSPEEMATLRALLATIVPATDVDLAGTVAARLAKGEGDGWRYDVLPADLAAYREGLARLGEGFAMKPSAERHAQLEALAAEKGTAAARWFEDVRADAVEAWVSHPATMARLGFSGPGVGGAYTPHRGFQRVGENEREGWEPFPVLAVAAVSR